MNSMTVIYVSLIACSIFFLVMNAVLQIRVKRIAESTHIIVNSQRTVLLRLVATLSKRIADENPSDTQAQESAKVSEHDAQVSERHPSI